MREIKFRAWMGASNELLSPVDLNMLCILNGGMGITEDAKIMQYTGLKDKNGVEIYEGDIVKLIHVEGQKPFDALYVSEFQDGCFMFRENFKGVANKWIGTIIGTPIEAIGNIYENKELLDG